MRTRSGRLRILSTGILVVAVGCGYGSEAGLPAVASPIGSTAVTAAATPVATVTASASVSAPSSSAAMGPGPAPAATTPAPVASPSRTLDAGAPLYFDGFTQPAPRGGTATAIIHTLPGITCSALFLWPGMPDGGQTVPPATADGSGTVTLRWTIDPATPPGSWRIDATCGGRVVSTHVPVR